MAQSPTELIKIGIVESIDDKTKSGRIKVRVAGLHGDEITTENLPWCSMSGSGTTSGGGGGAISVPEVGAEVRVKFKDPDDLTSMEWMANNKVDPDLVKEIASDYAGSTVLMHDSRQGATIKFQPNSGMTFYYAGSHIQICPDNTINIHYGEGNSGTMIQLADGKISISGNNEINISTPGTANIDADEITLNGKSVVKIKGSTAGEVAVNGNALINFLNSLATEVDSKVPQNFTMAAHLNAVKESILNQNVQYI